MHIASLFREIENLNDTQLGTVQSLAEEAGASDVAVSFDSATATARISMEIEKVRSKQALDRLLAALEEPSISLAA